jgi:hypothetical protein
MRALQVRAELKPLRWTLAYERTLCTKLLPVRPLAAMGTNDKHSARLIACRSIRVLQRRTQ